MSGFVPIMSTTRQVVLCNSATPSVNVLFSSSSSLSLRSSRRPCAPRTCWREARSSGSSWSWTAWWGQRTWRMPGPAPPATWGRWPYKRACTLWWSRKKGEKSFSAEHYLHVVGFVEDWQKVTLWFQFRSFRLSTKLTYQDKRAMSLPASPCGIPPILVVGGRVSWQDGWPQSESQPEFWNRGNKNYFVSCMHYFMTRK